MWRELTIEDVADVHGGGTPSTREPSYWGGDVAWATPSDITALNDYDLRGTDRTITQAGLSACSSKLHDPGAVMVTSRATVGAAAVARAPMATNQGFAVLVPNPDAILSEYLLFWVQATRHEWEARAGGSTFPEIGRAAVRSLPVRVPPLDAQRRIVDVIQRFDRVVSSLGEVVSANDAALQSLCDRVGGELLTGSKHTLADVLDPVERPVSIVDETLYQQVTLHAYGKGASPRGAKLGRDIGTKRQFKVHAGDFLMSKIDAFRGAFGVAQQELHGAIVTGDFPTFQLKRDVLDEPLLRCLYRSAQLVAMCNAFALGTTNRRRLKPAELLRVPLDLPDVARAAAYASAYQKLDQQVAAAATRHRAALTARGSMLHALLSGELAIPDAYDRLFDTAAEAS